MSYEDQIAFYDEVWALYPSQIHFTAQALDEFFRKFSHAGDRVIEVGGWRGEAAAYILPLHGLAAWRNLEICKGAAETPVVDAGWPYHAIQPPCWAWEIEPVANSYEIAVYSHVIEHMASDQLRRLFEWTAALGVRAMYVESPLNCCGQDWKEYPGSHVLTDGWTAVTNKAALAGFETIEIPIYVNSRYFSR